MMKDGDRNRPVTLVAFIQQSCSEIARGNPPTVAQEVTVVEAFLQVTEAAGAGGGAPGWDGRQRLRLPGAHAQPHGLPVAATVARGPALPASSTARSAK